VIRQNKRELAGADWRAAGQCRRVHRGHKKEGKKKPRERQWGRKMSAVYSVLFEQKKVVTPAMGSGPATRHRHVILADQWPGRGAPCCWEAMAFLVAASREVVSSMIKRAVLPSKSDMVEANGVQAVVQVSPDRVDSRLKWCVKANGALMPGREVCGASWLRCCTKGLGPSSLGAPIAEKVARVPRPAMGPPHVGRFGPGPKVNWGQLICRRRPRS
jgi:hypothetical protein